MRYHPKRPFAREVWCKLILEGGDDDDGIVNYDIRDSYELEYRVVRVMMECLTPTEMHVLFRHLADGWSFNDVGEDFAPMVSREWVRQIENRAFEKMRKPVFLRYIVGIAVDLPSDKLAEAGERPHIPRPPVEPLTPESSIRLLNLSNRSKNALWKAGIHTIAQMFDADLRRVRQLGEKSQEEVEQMIEMLKREFKKTAEAS